MIKLESLGAVTHTHTHTYIQVASKSDVSFANPKIENISGESM